MIAVVHGVVSEAFEATVGHPVHADDRSGRIYTSPAVHEFVRIHPDSARLVAHTVWVQGRLPTLHMRSYGVTVQIDPAATPDAMRAQALHQIEASLEIERSRRAQKESLGLTHDPEADDISHLITDRTSLETLTELTGSRDGAFDWMTVQMKGYVKYGSSMPTVRVQGLHVYPGLPIESGIPSLPREEDSFTNFFATVWTGPRLQIWSMVPDTVVALMVGRRVEEIVGGLPIGDRRILASYNGHRIVRLELEKDDVPFV